MNHEQHQKIKKHLRAEELDSARVSLLTYTEQFMQECILKCRKNISTESGNISHVAHYTRIEVLLSMLGIDPNTGNREQGTNTTIRFYDPNSMNDPQEGRTLWKNRQGRMFDDIQRGGIKARIGEEYSSTYLMSFVGGCNDNVGDTLLFWRLYGENGMGCSVQRSFCSVQRSFNSNIPPPKIYPVVYEKEDCKQMQKKLKPYFQYANSLYEKYEDEKRDNFARDFLRLCDDVRFLYKSDIYRHENEYRMIVKAESSDVRYDFVKNSPSGPRLRKYVAQNGSGFLSTCSTITVGPAVADGERVCRHLEAMAKKAGYYGPKFRHSKIPHRFSPGF